MPSLFLVYSILRLTQNTMPEMENYSSIYNFYKAKRKNVFNCALLSSLLLA